MVATKSLLERVAELHGRSASSTASLHDSILNHLRDLLNARAGESVSRPDYGPPDLAELERRAGPSSVARAIRDLIERFEPRLEIVDVTPAGKVDGAEDLRITIVARIAGTPESVRYVTRLDNAGHVAIDR